MMKPRLIMENVTQTFQDGESSVTILDGLSLEVGEGSWSP